MSVRVGRSGSGGVSGIRLSGTGPVLSFGHSLLSSRLLRQSQGVQGGSGYSEIRPPRTRVSVSCLSVQMSVGVGEEGDGCRLTTGAVPVVTNLCTCTLLRQDPDREDKGSTHRVRSVSRKDPEAKEDTFRPILFADGVSLFFPVSSGNCFTLGNSNFLTGAGTVFLYSPYLRPPRVPCRQVRNYHLRIQIGKVPGPTLVVFII